MRPSAPTVCRRSLLERVKEELSRETGPSGTSGRTESLRASVSVKSVGGESLRVDCVRNNPARPPLVANRVATLFVEGADR